MRIPIACTLTETAARSQRDEWSRLLEAAVVDAERVSETEVLLRLADDADQHAAALSLARREKACCPFFSFAFLVEADGLTLRVAVPPGAGDTLDDLARRS